MHAERRITMPRGPYLKTGRTPKQELRLQRVIENVGNGAQAAQEVYNCTTCQSASAMASQNLNHPRIRPNLEKAFLRHSVTPDKLAEAIAGALVENKTDEADHPACMNAVKLVARMLGMNSPPVEQCQSSVTVWAKQPTAVLRFIATHGRHPIETERQRIIRTGDVEKG
jgi:hypothetical protein